MLKAARLGVLGDFAQAAFMVHFLLGNAVKLSSILVRLEFFPRRILLCFWFSENHGLGLRMGYKEQLSRI